MTSCYFGDEKESPPKKIVLPPLEQLALSLSEKGFLINKQRMIVLTFASTEEGTKNPYGNILAEKLTTELVKKDRFLVLDRTVNDKMLKEKGLSLESSADIATLRRIGEVLNLDVLVTGFISPYKDGVVVNTRLIEIKTGLILKAEEVYVLIDG